jgi:class 3 adenylate cyclase
MDDILDEIEQAILHCEEAAQPFQSNSLLDFHARIRSSVNDAAQSWSGSWIGYQSRVYKHGLVPKLPGDHFSVMRGISASSGGPWTEYPNGLIRNEILTRASATDWTELEAADEIARKAFGEVKREMLPTLMALQGHSADPIIKDKIAEIAALDSRIWAQVYIDASRPLQDYHTQDMRAVEEGPTCPPHLLVDAQAFEMFSSGNNLRDLTDKLRFILKYLRVQQKAHESAASVERHSMELKTKTRSILFMDVSGWSKLSAHTIHEYVTKAMPVLAKQISGQDFMNTWGDAIVATFDSAKEAAESALRIKAFFSQSYPHQGVAQGLSCRISLHTGEVILCENPLRGGEDIFGDAVHKAARLEPVTAPGHVFCTDAFASHLKGVEGVAPKAWLLASKLQLPKGYGEVEASVVTWIGDPDPRPGLAEFLDSKVATPAQAPEVSTLSTFRG